MRVLSGLLWASAALRIYAAPQEASVYFQDGLRPAQSSKTPSVSPNTVRLLLAQRLGLSQYHDLGDADEETLAALNSYGVKQQMIFEDEEESRQQSTDKLLFIVEGVEHPEDVMTADMTHPAKTGPSITMSNPPNTAQNAQLAQDLLEQSLHAGSGKTMSHIKHNLSLQGLSRKDGQRYTHAITTIKTILKTFQHQLPDTGRTIILMPPTAKSKRSTEPSPYGIYAMPLTSRHAQGRQQEEPLEASPPADSPTTSQILPSNSTTNTTLPKGILKICHSKEEDAIAATNNCSSHGSVYLRAKGHIDCWACRCGTTTSSNGKKTTHWGGPACQKKDVSMQFWLLAGLTILLVSVVSWGVGLLVSIGQEDLPSVIGAGVAGPRPQK